MYNRPLRLFTPATEAPLLLKTGVASRESGQAIQVQSDVLKSSPGGIARVVIVQLFEEKFELILTLLSGIIQKGPKRNEY